MLIKFSCCLLLKVDVYVGLSDNQAQRLGNLHNAKRKPLTFMNMCKQARTLLFEMSEVTEGVDETQSKLPKNYRCMFAHHLAHNLGHVIRQASKAYL